ncbi:MAG: amidohydrolase family protein [Chloroflexi bacterium]|nr:amidohydrolase family protein [Chloroflexota bacterium]
MAARDPVTSRRALLRAAGASALLAACERALPSPTATPSPAPAPIATVAPAPRPAPSPTLAGPRVIRIEAAAVADGGAPSVTRNVSILLREGRILYAGPRDGAPDVRDPEVVELRTLTVVPAMVDCHAHITGTGGDDAHARLQDPDDVLLARATANAGLLVRAGVLGIRDVGAVRSANVRARDALRARTDAPYIVAAGTWIARRGRYVPFAIQVDTADDLHAAAMAQLDAGADLVKIASDGATGSAAHFTVAELKRTVDAVHARGKKVAAHSQGFGARVAAEAGADTIEHGFTIDAATASAMRGRATLVTSLSTAQAFAQLEIALPSIRAAREAGVRIATGTDAGGAPPRFGDFAVEVELLVRAGLPPHEALASATRVGGEVLGIAGLGTLSAAAPADLVLVDGDPLADPSALKRVRAVYRAGTRIV